MQMGRAETSNTPKEEGWPRGYYIARKRVPPENLKPVNIHAGERCQCGAVMELGQNCRKCSR